MRISKTSRRGDGDTYPCSTTITLCVNVRVPAGVERAQTLPPHRRAREQAATTSSLASVVRGCGSDESRPA